MSANHALREGLRLTREVSTAKALRDALRIVRGVLDESLNDKGLTTTEIYDLATRKAPALNFEPAPLPKHAVSMPPNPDHPVRSVRYLKKTILPILEGNGVIRMKQVVRTSDAPSNPSQPQKLFAWTPVDPNTLPKPKIPQPEKPFIGTAVGIGQDLSHLNTRRRRARVEKVTRDYTRMKEVLKQHGEKILLDQP